MTAMEKKLEQLEKLRTEYIPELFIEFEKMRQEVDALRLRISMLERDVHPRLKEVERRCSLDVYEDEATSNSSISGSTAETKAGE